MEREEFKKVIGYKAIVDELNRVCDCMRAPEKYRALGVSTPHGLLLHGAPGLGKTLMANCFIEASGRRVFTCRKDLPDGEFIRHIKNIFASAKENAPSIVFLDDMDKFSNDDGRYNNAEEFVTVQACIDDCHGVEVFVLATANNLRNIPDSLLRSGRFDKIIRVDAPEGVDAARITLHYLKDKKCADDVDAAEISRILAGKSCADLETVVNEAGLYAAYDNRDKITMADMVNACMRMLFNAPATTPSDAEPHMDRIAYHEAGHALIFELLVPGSVNFVSLSAYSGDSRGVTVAEKPKGYFLRKQHMEDRVTAILGGKAASDLVFGEVDTGANNDLHRAFDIVERFVDNYCSYGFDKWEQCRNSSNDMLARRDNQMAADMQNYYNRAKSILRENRATLDNLAEILLKRQTLLGSEVRKVIAGENI